MGGILIEEDLFVKYSIVDNKLPEGQKIHEFLLARAEALAGRYIDFKKTPVTFVLSDTDAPNAFFAHVFHPKNKPRRHSDETIRYIKNPLPTPVICITRGLVEMVDNLDQLDFILGHELTHMLMRDFGIRHNSKGEEEIADLHAVDLIYDAGGDPKQALIMSGKIASHAKAKRDEEERYERKSSRNGKEEGVDWSSILDVHMSDSNRKSGIEASLTRLSHLIDERTPTEIDKIAFEARYDDPIDKFLAAHNYKRRKPLGQLKLLVDCIEHISVYIPPEDYFRNRMDSLDEEDPDGTDYFRGPLIEKKYQQKIANLAEAVINEARKGRERKGNQSNTAEINAIDLNVYLQNRAYQHIERHGYPMPRDINYLEASGILYSYFFALLSEHTIRWNKRRDEEEVPACRPQIELDIDKARKEIESATNADQFISSTEEFKRLSRIQRDIRTLGYNTHTAKLDNLSGISTHRSRTAPREARAYGEPTVGKAILWNNLVEVAKIDAGAKDHVVKFLAGERIEDFRITHNLPYIRIGNYSCYGVDELLHVFTEEVPGYEVDFAINRDVVLAAYDYIRNYFDNEEALIERICSEAVNIDDQDFRKHETLKNAFDTIVQKKVYDFVSMFNALPEEERGDKYFGKQRDSLSLIPNSFRVENPLPGRSEEGRPTVSRELFEFDNPIFQDYFGEDFKDRLVARKNTQQQIMFEASFAILKRAVDIWLDVSPEHAALKEKSSALQKEMWKAPREEREEKEKKLKPIERKLNFYSSKKDLAEQLIFNFLFSIFEKDKYWYHLQRLTPEQERIFADFAVKDEKGAILRIFNSSQYEYYCDYLGILEEQTAQVVSGNYELTDAMKVVANNYGYCSVNTQESLRAFVQENKNKGGNRDYNKYAWYLHVFDTMKYLENSSSIDIRSLLVSLTRIVEVDRSSNGQDSGEIVRARYANYKRLITESTLLPLVSKAVGCEWNYEGLSFENATETMDLMFSVRNKMAGILVHIYTSGYSSSEEKISVEPEHQKFLDLLDKNIKNLFREAESLALGEDKALEKMVKLYSLYHYKAKSYSSDPSRYYYMRTMIKEGDNLKKLSSMSMDSSFWPQDALDHVKAFVLAKNVFLDDKQFEDKILNDILNKVEIIPSGRKKSECLYILLDKKIRAAYPETRDRLFDIYAQDVSARLGKDDSSRKYQRRLSVYLNALDDSTEKEWDIGKKHGQQGAMLSNLISAADKYLLLRRVSDLIVSQEQTSQMLKQACQQVSLNSDDMLYSYLYGIGVDYLTERMDKDPEMANRFVRFLNSKGEKADCEVISSYTEATLRQDCCEVISSYTEATLRQDYKDNQDQLSEILKQTDASKCKILYENFWSAPLEARAVVIARVLKSAVNKEVDQNEEAHSWEQVFDVVMDNIIRPDDDSVEAKYARDIMHSYIKSRSDYERVLILSAMMVANRNIGENIGNVGKALKLFLENMGPAEIKLGQAIASHPDTPESIRKELQHLKGTANMPARWTVYDWIRAENIPEEFWKNEYVGEIMGSASYYITIALGEDEVLRMLQPEAREKATKGFRVIRSTVDDLRENEDSSKLSYQELTHAVQEMVIQAARMSEIETDHDLGQQQYEYAKDIYDNVTLISGSETFSLKVMDWRAKGENWIIMDRANGPTFNALPEDTLEQIEYKKQFAKAYILFEMTNILSGRKFDHDRHGAQLSVDTKANRAGIYDTGAMALQDPSPEEQKMLGGIIYDVFRAAMRGEDVALSFGRVTGEKIEELHNSGQNTQYLVEVKKGVLALGDFFRILDRDDVRGILPNINIAADLSKDVRDEITEGMSLFEKAQWQAFIAMQSASGGADVVIQRKNQAAQTVIDVETIVVAPQEARKASWLRDIFGAGPDGKTRVGANGSGYAHKTYGCQERYVNLT